MSGWRLAGYILLGWVAVCSMLTVAYMLATRLGWQPFKERQR